MRLVVLIILGLGLGAAATCFVAPPRPAAAGAAEFTGRRVVQWVGRAHALRYTRRPAGYYTADEFAFTFESPRGRRQVVSREPTPFETYRFGTTFTGIEVDWSAAPEVRLTAVTGIDRIPPEYPGLKLEEERTLTALLLEVRRDGGWKPWYINNWFHRWSTPEDDARITAEYAGKGAGYDVYGFRDELPAPLTAASAQIAGRFPAWRAYHGVIVRGAAGLGLELRHLFQKNPGTGGYDCVYGDPSTLVPLSRPSPVRLTSQASAQPGVRTTSAPPPVRPSAGTPAVGWWMLGGGPEHRGLAAPLPPPLMLAWEAGGGKAFAGGPVVAAGRVYIGSNDGKLYCFEAASGRPVWAFTTGAEVEATPAVSGGLVVVGSFDGHLYAVDAADGKERWRFKTGARLPGFQGIEEVKQGVDSSPAVVDGRVYFGAWDGKAYCLDAATGKPVWSRQLGGIVHWSSPAVSGGKVLLGATDGKLYCLNASTGAELWATPLAGKHLDHMMSGPTVADGVAYVGGGYENGFYAVDVASGKVRWTYTARNLVCGSAAVSGDRVYGFSDAEGHVFCLDRSSGKEVWARRFGAGWGACSPVLSGATLYVTMRDGKDEAGKPVALVALEAATGKTLWSHGAGPAWSGPAIGAGLLFYGSDDGKLRAFRP